MYNPGTTINYETSFPWTEYPNSAKSTRILPRPEPGNNILIFYDLSSNGKYFYTSLFIGSKAIFLSVDPSFDHSRTNYFRVEISLLYIKSETANGFGISIPFWFIGKLNK